MISEKHLTYSAIILKILRACGFRDHAIKFIFAYLSNRSMITSGATGCDHTCGVGQGSEPGGNFLLAFINSVFACFLFLLVIWFVNDAQGYLYVAVDDINSATQRANADSASLVAWACESDISLNPQKTQAILIGSRSSLRELSNLIHSPLSLMAK